MRKPSSFESARDEELDRAFRLLERGEDPVRVIDALSRRLTSRLIHVPTKAVYESAGEDRRALLEVLANLVPARSV